MAELTRYHRERCLSIWCQRADGVICADGECDIESGIYCGPIKPAPGQHARQHEETRAAINDAAETHDDALRRLANR